MVELLDEAPGSQVLVAGDVGNGESFAGGDAGALQPLDGFYALSRPARLAGALSSIQATAT